AGATAAVGVTIACGLFWGLQKAAAYDFHELSFAPLLIALAILGQERRDTRTFATASVLLCFVKEDMIPLVGVFGLWLALAGDRGRGLLIMTAAAFPFTLVMKVIIPALSSSPGSPYLQSYGSLGRGGLLAPLIQLVTPPAKLLTVVCWLAPFAFLPLGSPLVLLAVPIAPSPPLSSVPNPRGTTF